MIARRSSLIVFAAIPFVFAVSACEDSVTAPPSEDFELQPGHALLAEGADVTLEVEADGFEPGAEVTLLLVNQSGEPVGFNLCFHELERFTDDGWKGSEEQEDRICTAVLHIIDPGEDARYEASLPATLSPGEYRFRVALHLMDQGEFRDQVSDPFHIEG